MAVTPTGGSNGGSASDIEQMKQLQAENRQHSLDMFRLQQMANRDSETSSTRSNIAKAQHDAIMNMSNNVK